jgi:hypothetical protein
MPKECPEGKILNPKTNRCINDTPANRKKIKDENKLKSQVNIKQTEELLISKPRDYIAPSMGPIIHYNYKYQPGISKEGVVMDNMFNLFKYINNRIKAIVKNEEIIGKIEFIELLDFMKLFRKYYKDDDDFLKVINKNEKKFLDFGNNRTFINDIPKEEFVHNIQIHPERIKNRGELIRIYAWTTICIDRMKDITERNQNERATIGAGEIMNLYNQKYYVDTLIKKKIFREEDLYGKMFESKNIWKELRNIYSQYRIKYNELYEKYPGAELSSVSKSSSKSSSK